MISQLSLCLYVNDFTEYFSVFAFTYDPIKRLKGHLVDALALRGDEGRDTLR